MLSVHTTYTLVVTTAEIVFSCAHRCCMLILSAPRSSRTGLDIQERDKRRPASVWRLCRKRCEGMISSFSQMELDHR